MDAVESTRRNRLGGVYISISGSSTAPNHYSAIPLPSDARSHAEARFHRASSPFDTKGGWSGKSILPSFLMEAPLRPALFLAYRARGADDAVEGSMSQSPGRTVGWVEPTARVPLSPTGVTIAPPNPGPSLHASWERSRAGSAQHPLATPTINPADPFHRSIDPSCTASPRPQTPGSQPSPSPTGPIAIGGGIEAPDGEEEGPTVLIDSLQDYVVPSMTVARQRQVAAAAAATATNPIVLENQKPGNPPSEWDIQGAGSSNIEGFATDISANLGQTVNFKINTNSTNYRIDIYRLGYYGGLGARRVATIQRQSGSPQIQPNPIRDAATGLVDAGNWQVSSSWQVPADAVSGVYVAKLVRQDGTFGENHIPFIVRDDSSRSDIVYQTADTTWQAYNPWGGANFYGGNGPGTGSLGTGRAFKLSYNRPITSRGGGLFAGPQDFIFGVEYPAIRWLEANGYDVSYLSGLDASRSGNLLLNHKVYLDVGHDEYWSGDQRTNVEAARDAGVNLAFWSGNEVYWKTRWEPSIAGTPTANRTLVSYKETWANGDIDPSNQWTGTYRDPRFTGPNALGGGRPENALTGTMFQVDAYRLDTIQVPAALADARFWRGTSVANTQPGQTASLTTNYLGYEWDEDRDNGFRPAGLINLSSTTVPVSSYLLDYGNTVGQGTATHSLTLYRAPSGALVFGAGTVYWAWGLDPMHDNEPTPADPRVQQAMVNLFADMAVQPGTLQSGLAAATASTDHTAPASIITSPTSSGTISSGQSVTITGTATDSGGVVAGMEVSTDGGATWRKATGQGNWTYSWVPAAAGSYTIRSRAADDSVNLEAPGSGVTVTVSGPSWVSLFPSSATPATITENDSSSVELGVKFAASAAGTISGIRFYKGPQNTGTHTGSLWSSTGTRLATVTFINETASGWQTATFSSPVAIVAGTTYVASYHSNGRYSSNGSYFTSTYTNGPLTAPASGSSGGNGVYAYGSASAFPTSSFNASNYWVDVLYNQSSGGTNQVPVATNDSGFSTAQNTALSIAASSLLANDTDPNGDPLTVTGVSSPTNGTVGLSGQTITFTPTTGYTGPAGFAYAISDGRGGTAAANVSLTVTAPASGQSLFASSATPSTVTVNDPNPVELGMKFRADVAGTISGIRFYKGPQNTGTHIGSLWSATGTRLATVTFTNETASGWQTATLSQPVAIQPNNTYVVSYHSNGRYSANGNFFSTEVANGQLHALASGASGGNGVYAYGSASAFPTSSFNASNYWVDVVFNPQLAA